MPRCPCARDPSPGRRVPYCVTAKGLGTQRRAVGLHQRPSVRLLVVRHAHHEDLHLDAEERAGKRERRAPLAGARLGGDLLDAGFAVVERLRDRGVRLVAAGRADAFVLVVDARRRLQRLLEAPGAEERRRAPLAVDVAHRPGDLDLALVDTSCMISAMGKSGARSSGPSGCSVPGCRGGGHGAGRSAARLYQVVGSRDSSSRYFTRSFMVTSVGWTVGSKRRREVYSCARRRDAMHATIRTAG